MEISTIKTKTFINEICLFHFDYISKVADLTHDGEYLHKYTFNNTPVSYNRYDEKIKKIYENFINEVRDNKLLLSTDKIPNYLNELLHDLVECKKIITENIDIFNHYFNNGTLNQRGILQEDGFYREITKKERDLSIEDEKTGNYIEIKSGYYFLIKTPRVFYWSTPQKEDYTRMISTHETCINKAIERINNIILSQENYKTLSKKNNLPKPPLKTFPEYILHEKNKEIAKLIKSEFSTEKGKSIRLIIEVLIKKKMFTIENRQRQKIYDAMKKYFDRDIGTKQSIFDPSINEKSDRLDFESIELKINFILSRINKTK